MPYFRKFYILAMNNRADSFTPIHYFVSIFKKYISPTDIHISKFFTEFNVNAPIALLKLYSQSW